MSKKARADPDRRRGGRRLRSVTLNQPQWAHQLEGLVLVIGAAFGIRPPTPGMNMWVRPSAEVQLDAIELLVSASCATRPQTIYDVERDRIFFVSESGKAKVAILHCSAASRLVRSVYPGWPA
jgi:hypothetical protein